MSPISSLRVADCMSSMLITATQTLKVSDAAEVMESHGILHLPVRDERGRLVGIVSDRDVRLAAYLDPSDDDAVVVYPDAPVWQIMTPRVIDVSSSAPVSEAATLMRDNRVGALIVRHRGRAIGVVSSEDLLGLLSSLPQTASWGERSRMRMRGGL